MIPKKRNSKVSVGRDIIFEGSHDTSSISLIMLRSFKCYDHFQVWSITIFKLLGIWSQNQSERIQKKDENAMVDHYVIGMNKVYYSCNEVQSMSISTGHHYH
ncbi:uncharacterized protein BX664DRAFT_317626 [Halteromyces radiatus]|uniref:uncharacterized protein n=1 Tax=Halteromyces radiatus TaxID=101107 RepID=UPI00221E6E33|nr:uncharacterized protein BX664DRAFT_317626 [Halteromyces radiatus]KAI8081792.1 hypothetical protein BX664DRAFT_317626 [Halteromyces radiatus]